MTQHDIPFRVGHGFDVHRFTRGDSIVMGGVKIPHTHAFEAHSDGDVLIHSVCDALLGAIAAGDIGQHFPDTDMAYKNIDSCVLLARVYKLVIDHGYKLGNLDVTVIAQSPRFAPFIEQIRERLAAEFNSAIDQINVKATTTERLGYIGRDEGIAVHSVAILANR